MRGQGNMRGQWEHGGQGGYKGTSGDMRDINRAQMSEVYLVPSSSGDAVDLNTILDPHTVAGLMKAHFREQKSSIIPRGEPLAAIVKAVEQKNVRDQSLEDWGERLWQ